MSEGKPSILCIGSVNADSFMRLQNIPKPGETVTGGVLSTALGGKGANAAVAARRAGAEVTFCCAVGNDPAGREALETLRQEGLNLDHCMVSAASATGAAFILLDAQGQNSIAVAPGANFDWDASRMELFLPVIAGAAMVLLGNEITPAATASALEIARTCGTPVLLNYAPVADQAVPLSDAITVLVVNEGEASALLANLVTDVPSAQEAARALRQRGPKKVIVTLGAHGVVLCDENGVRHQPGFVVQPVDTVAAGDTFCGVLALAFCEGRSFDEAARFAQAAAAFCVTRSGALPSIPTRAEITAILP